ncbi:MAG: DUF4426 domain-containing protein [Thiohalomonadaceae bacterium]
MIRTALAVAFTLAVTTGTAQALQAVEFGNYIIHYNAFTADMLHPPIAKSHGIQRSQNRGVLTVAIQRKPAKAPADVAAEVDAQALTLNQQLRTLKMREIREGDAIYYLADFPVRNEEVLDFEVNVKPQQLAEPYTFRFRQQFFTEPPRRK